MKNRKSKLRAWDAKDYKVYYHNGILEFEDISHADFVSSRLKHIHMKYMIMNFININDDHCYAYM